MRSGWKTAVVGTSFLGLCAVVALVWAGSVPAETASPAPHDPGSHGMMTHDSHAAAHPGAVNAETTDEETAYSLFMHRSSGVVLILLGALVLADRLTGHRYGTILIGIGVLWLLFGAHLFIRSDPEGWPIGPAGLLESFTMPTASEWIQHKVLSLIPLALGVWTFLSRRAPLQGRWSYALGGVIALGGAGLLIHQHADHQTMDIVNLQHRFMALTALFIAGSSVADGLAQLTWKAKPFLMPCGLIMLGLQLTLYVE